jgi:hypothetical protein
MRTADRLAGESAICAAISSFHIETVEMQAVHVSSEGSIQLRATESEQGLWMARISGCESAGKVIDELGLPR